MRARNSIVAASVAGLTAAVAIGFASFGAPVVSTSTLTLPSSDSVGVVVVYTSRCTTAMDVARQMKGDTLACPKAWNVAADYPDGFAVRRSAARTVLRDTVRIAKPVCPGTVALTAVVTPINRATGVPILDKSGTARINIRCRNPSAAEAAFADSFPTASYVYVSPQPFVFKATPAERAQMKAERLALMLTAVDSAAELQEWANIEAGPDSLPISRNFTPGAREMSTVKGYSFSVCVLVKNRYTGVVVELSPDTTDTRCDEAQRILQEQRSANTGIVPEQFWKPPNRNS